MLEITALTCIVYVIANAFTRERALSKPCEKPLFDVLHDSLPDYSTHVHVRDVALLFMFVPLVFVKKKTAFAKEFWKAFLWVALFKAACIFFTHVPSSHPRCGDAAYLNHCHHIQVSGHAAVSMLLAVLFVRHGTVGAATAATAAIAYGLLIVLTRAHYTCNVFEGWIVAYLLVR